jgi:four helix bundle protein
MSARKRHNYKNLKIWQLGLKISFKVSDLIVEFPKHERYDLSSQMSRCSVSIPSNIAEGSAKSNKSFSNYLDISLGSSFELSTQLLVAHYRKYINQNTLSELEIEIEEFQQMTMGFQNGLGN